MNNIYKPKWLFMASKYPIPPTLEPTGVHQTIKDPNWRQAMSEEFTTLVRHGTLKLVPPIPRQNLVGSKWVFCIKYTLDGSVDRYKACLIAKGFHQRLGLDFT